MLVPGTYRCPDHDNHEVVSARVRESVEREAAWHLGERGASFRVAVLCPGGPAADAHRRVYEGTWQYDDVVEPVRAR